MENNSNQKQDCPLVFVRCLTFNHEAYIEDALNGFVMQQTNFPFVVTIVNDASPDNTKNVIEKFITNICESSNIIHEQTSYADIIKATPKENPNCLLFILNLYENHFLKKSHRPYYQEYVDKAKYWAECEGDDYWTDPLKLQKQVDFMEANIEYSICFHKVNTLIQETGEMKEEFLVRDMPGKSTILDLAVGNYIHWPTVLIRYDKNIQDKFSTMGACLPGDYVLLMLYAEKGDIYKFNEPMAVYRYGSGVWSDKQNDTNLLLYIQTLCKMSVVVDEKVKRILQQSQINPISKNFCATIENLKKQHLQVRSSHAYRIGVLLLNPIKKIRKYLQFSNYN